jgi:hypothetical protein
MESRGASGYSGKRKGPRAGARGHSKNVRGKTLPAKVLSSKLAISFETPLADEVRRAAELETEGNVSAWLAEAARDRLRQMHAQALLDEYLAATGPIPQDIVDEVRRQWPR